MRHWWARWKRFAQRVGDFQARVILTLMYFLVVGPFAVILRLISDPLRLRRPRRPSLWTPPPPDPATLATARRQV